MTRLCSIRALMVLATLFWLALSAAQGQPAAAAVPAAAEPQAGAGETLDLASLMDEAFANSPIMIAARQNIHVFEAKLQEAWWAWFPNARVEFRLGLTPAKRGDPILGETDFSEWGIHWRVRVEGAMPIYTFGKIAALKRAARAGVDVAEATREAAGAELAFRVRQAYFGYQLGRQMEDIVADGRRYLDRARTRLERMEEEDDPDFDPVDLLRLRVYQADVETLVVQSRRIQQQSLHGLGLLLGRTGGDGVGRSGPPFTVAGHDLEPEGPSLDDLSTRVAQSAGQQPGLEIARHGAAARHALADARFAEMFPDLFIGAYFSYAQSPVTEPQSSPYAYDPWNSWFGGAGVGLRYDLDIPSKLARLRGSRAEAAKTEAMGDVAAAQVALEVESAWRETEQARELLPTYRRAQRAARSWVMAKSDLYDGGFAPLQEVTEALVEFYKRQIGYLQAVHDHNIAVARLSRALGVDLFDPGPSETAAAASPFEEASAKRTP